MLGLFAALNCLCHEDGLFFLLRFLCVCVRARALVYVCVYQKNAVLSLSLTLSRSVCPPL